MRMGDKHKPGSSSSHLRSSVGVGEPRESGKLLGSVNSSAGSHPKPAPHSTAKTFGAQFPHPGGERMPGHQSHCPSQLWGWVACPHLSPSHGTTWSTPTPGACRVAPGLVASSPLWPNPAPAHSWHERQLLQQGHGCGRPQTREPRCKSQQVKALVGAGGWCHHVYMVAGARVGGIGTCCETFQGKGFAGCDPAMK